MYQRYVQHIVFREKCRGEKCEWAEAAVICGMWWMTDSGGGLIQEPVVTPILTQCNDQASGRKREKGRQINTEWWPDVEEGKRDEREMKKKKNVGRPVLMFLGSETKDTAGGVGGCQSGTGASSICHLSFSLSSRYLFFPPFPSFHASVLLFLASRGSVAKANKQRRLFISASGE